MRMKKNWLVLLAVLMAAALLCAACGSTAPGSGAAGSPASTAGGGSAPAGGPKTALSVSTGGTTGMYYTTMAPICDYINAQSATIRVVPATSGGSTENLNNVLSGVSDLGCVYNNEVISGYERDDSLRFVGPTTKCSPLQFVVKADSGIEKLEDLRGKQVHLGAAGSGARAWATTFFEWAGLMNDVVEVPLGHEETVTGLGDNDVAMITVAALAPSARVTEASNSYEIRLLDLTPYMDDFLKEYPYFETYTVPGGTYKGCEQDVLTFGLATSIVCSEDMDSAALKEFMTWAYCEEAQNAALESNPVGPDHNPEDPLAGMSIPIHPAAAEFWTGKGFTVPTL